MAVACQMGSCCYHSTMYGFRSFTSCAIPRTPVLRCRTCKGRPTITAADRQGGGVLDRPDTSVSPPMTLPGDDVRKVRQKQKPRNYKVMLHNDSVNRREYVVRVLLKVIKSLSVDDAVNAMQQAHLHGLACVIACAQDEAEQYCEGLRSNGLIASIEPAGTGSGGDEPSV